MEQVDQKMLSSERERRILELLQDTTVMSVAQLSRELAVSAATVRRDLQDLHDQGLLQRVHGGATVHSMSRVEPVFQDKEALNSDAKQAIASNALEFIEDYDRIYLDGGSTALMLARRLDRRKSLTVVTNSLMAAQALMTMEHKLVIVGGEFRAISRTLVGPLTSSVIDSIHVEKAFMGTIGFSAADGMTTTDTDEAYTKERVMARSSSVYLLADSSKLGVSSFARSGSPDVINTLITEDVPADFRREVENLGIEIIVAEKPHNN